MLQPRQPHLHTTTLLNKSLIGHARALVFMYHSLTALAFGRPILRVASNAIYKCQLIGNILSDTIQSCTIDSNLIIHLVGLVNDPINMLVLCVNLLAHRSAQHVKCFGTAVNCIPVEMSVIMHQKHLHRCSTYKLSSISFSISSSSLSASNWYLARSAKFLLAPG